MKQQVLFVLTSTSKMTNGNPTGWYLNELAHPYEEFKANFDITIASPNGGVAPMDPGSDSGEKNDEIVKNFLKDKDAIHATKNTLKLSDVEKDLSQFVAVIYPGGHGPMFDLATDATSQKIISEMYEAGKPVAAVCHGPACFVNVKLSSGDYLIQGKKVTGFSDVEEEMAGMVSAMPFSLEQKLQANGGKYEKSDAPWAAHVAVDGLLVTGQNPHSATALAKAVLKLLE